MIYFLIITIWILFAVLAMKILFHQFDKLTLFDITICIIFSPITLAVAFSLWAEDFIIMRKK